MTFTIPTVRTANPKSNRSRALGAALALSLALGACGNAEDSLEPDTLAMLDEATSTTAESETTEAPADIPDDQSEDQPEDSTKPAPESEAPTTVPMSAPEAPNPENPAPAAPAPSEPAAPDAPADPTADVPADAGELAQAEAESFRLLNELRASLGLAQLTRASDMDAFARNWSQTMASTGEFEHSDGPYGENIAWNSQSSLSPAEAAAAMHEMWINSPGHYANMTSPDYTLAGMGFYKDASGWHATHVFDR